VKQRESFQLIISEPAKQRLKNNQCPACGLPKDDWKRRKDWNCCSIACSRIFYKEYRCFGWGELRLKVFERDNHTCIKCGKKPKKVDWRYNEETQRGEDVPTDKPDDSQLIGDHILPIALGGEQWDINNIQTLCIECNKIKTKEDAGNIAKQRVIERNQEGNQILT